MKKKAIMIAIIILLVLSVAIGISYAYWILNLNQDSKNIVSTKCLNITFTEGDAINLQKTYPMDDEEGSKLTPYTFTLKNECNDKANYQINLETLAESTLDINYVKVKLNDEISVLGNNEAVTKTLDNATDSRMLETGILNANETKTFNLNVWLSYDAPNDTMNKNFESKITVTTSYHATLGTELVKDLVAGADPDSDEVYTVPDKTSDTCTYTLAYDNTVDNNIRYVGANPCNYVKVDGEYWRIIGSMNNIDDGLGNKETRLKLIRAESIGNYSWDYSEASVNNGNGVNEWSQSDLMKLLNPGYDDEEVGGSLYYNRGSGKCYKRTVQVECDFNETGLKSNLSNLIGNALWNLGSNGTTAYWYDSYGLSAKSFYNFERSQNSSKICSSGTYCNDNVPRTTEWIGKIGLMYPSDYAYSASNTDEMSRSECINSSNNWNNSKEASCKNANWFYLGYDPDYKDGDQGVHTLTPISQYFAMEYAKTGDHIFEISPYGNNSSSLAFYSNYVYPVVYLKTDVTILQGEGTKENPYQLGV